MSYIEINAEEVSATAWQETKAEVQADLLATFPPALRYAHRIDNNLVRVANVLVAVNAALIAVAAVALIAGK